MTKRSFIAAILWNLIVEGLGFQLQHGINNKNDMKMALYNAESAFHINKGVLDGGKASGLSFPRNRKGLIDVNEIYSNLSTLLDDYINDFSVKYAARCKLSQVGYFDIDAINEIYEDVMSIYNYNELVAYLKQLTQVEEEVMNTDAADHIDQTAEAITEEVIEIEVDEQEAREEATRLWQANADEVIAHQAEEALENNRKWLRIRQKARNKQLKDAYLGRNVASKQYSVKWIISEQPVLFQGTIVKHDVETAAFFEGYTPDPNLMAVFFEIDRQIEDPGVYAEAPGASAEMITALKNNEDAGLVELNNAVVDLLTAIPRQQRPQFCGIFSMYTVYLAHLRDASSRYDFIIVYEELKLIADMIYMISAGMLYIPIQNSYEYTI